MSADAPGGGDNEKAGGKRGTSARSWSDLGPRLISAFFLLVVTILMVWAGGIWFALLVSLVFAGMLREWETMITARPVSVLGMVLMGLLASVAFIALFFGMWWGLAAGLAGALVAFVGAPEHRVWRLWGHLLFATVVVGLIEIRGTGSPGFAACFFVGASVWMTDTGAFFSGRLLRGAKLSPDISPAKTWSGAIGGLIIGSLSGLLVWVLVTPSPWWIGLLIAAFISVSGQIGDLAESAVKRHFRVKDSGDAIPGHGGLMDRLDSLTFGTLLVFAIGLAKLGPGSVAAGLLFW